VTAKRQNKRRNRFAQSNYEDAESLFRRALNVKEKILDPEHPDTALTANNLGVLLQSVGRKEEAGELFRRALGVFESKLGIVHPKTVMARENLVATR